MHNAESTDSSDDIASSSARLAPPTNRMESVGSGKAWGILTSVDLQDCDSHLIRDAKQIEAYVVQLCELIGMKRYGACQLVHFGEGRVAGYSMVQLIETSLISGHFANDTNSAYLDIFSCKGYDPAVVEEFSKNFFGARRSTHSALLRY
jgi:S-adenosylmethionine/arginine decarboxylase-like enzyme